MATTVVQNSNQGIRISGAVSATGTQASGVSTLYTAPSNSYAIVQVSFSGTLQNATVSVGGRIVYYPNASLIPASGTNALPVLTLHIGPGQSLQFTNSSGGGSGTMVASGVEFTNSLNGA